MGRQQVPLDPAGEASRDFGQDDATLEVAPDLAYRRLGIVNVAFYGTAGAGDRQWVLVDAGVMGTTGLITGAVEERFGANSRPAAIIMTHAHFDHVGGLEHLAEQWEVPVYAHDLERPYLDGTTSYPPPDPSVGGGLMSTLSVESAAISPRTRANNFVITDTDEIGRCKAPDRFGTEAILVSRHS